MNAASFLLPIAAGVALWLSFPDPGFFRIGWIALIPFLLFLLIEERWKRVIAGHYLFSLVYLGATVYWIPALLVGYGGLDWFSSVGVFFLMLLTLSTVLLPFSAIFFRIGRESPQAALVAAPGIWLAVELLRNEIPFGGFPWSALGYSQFPYKLIIQCADLGGVYLVSFVVVLVNVSILGLVKYRMKGLAVAAGTIFLAANLYGWYRLSIWEVSDDGYLAVGLIQPDIELARERDYYASQYFESVPELFNRVADEGAQLIILPEAQNPYFYPQNFYFKNFWEAQVKRRKVYFLFNSAASEDEEYREYFNSLHLLEPTGERSYRYDKVHLVPFGEYLPLADLLWFAGSLVSEVSAFKAGDKLEVGKIGPVRFGSLICYEAIFPELSRQLTAEGAQILFNVTNDRWFGRTSAPGQHLEMAGFRAVENRRYFVRVANSGYTAIITPRGDVQHQTRLFEPATVTARVGFNSIESPYTRFGSLLNIGIIIVTLAAGLLSLILRRNEGAR
ncbi:MAG: apolipoprotein N-acyltransferase [Acidobacteriota bacterium]|nr:MAG: apolipoprotein N-acyltransferase [Acidobacteriota bacterium]